MTIVTFASMRWSMVIMVLAGWLSEARTQMVLDSGTQMHLNTGTHVQLPENTSWEIRSNSDLINDGTLTLGAGSELQEQPGHGIHGQGTERIREQHAAPLINEEPGGLGLVLTTQNGPDSLLVIRGHQPFMDMMGNPGIRRWYSVVPETPTGTNGALELNYDATELNAIPEGSLILVHSDDGGTNWTSIPAVIDPVQDKATASGLDIDGHFTLFVHPDHVNVPETGSSNEGIRLAPSVTDGLTRLISDEVLQAGTVRIYDMRGALVKQVPGPTGKSMMLDVSTLMDGMYVVIAPEGNHLKLIKE